MVVLICMALGGSHAISEWQWILERFSITGSSVVINAGVVGVIKWGDVVGLLFVLWDLIVRSTGCEVFSKK